MGCGEIGPAGVTRRRLPVVESDQEERANAMISQATRNSSPSCAATVSAIPAVNRLRLSQLSAIHGAAPAGQDSSGHRSRSGQRGRTPATEKKRRAGRSEMQPAARECHRHNASAVPPREFGQPRRARDRSRRPRRPVRPSGKGRPGAKAARPPTQRQHRHATSR